MYVKIFIIRYLSRFPMFTFYGNILAFSWLGNFVTLLFQFNTQVGLPAWQDMTTHDR